MMLFPKFVIDRINSFEASSNFVADDAGEVTILFCDICQFDSVVKECQNDVVKILD